MKKLTFMLFQLALLAGVFMTEFWPNKYVSNILVLFKAFVGIQTAAVWAMIGTFSMRVPSQSTINNAIEMTREEKKTFLQHVAKWIARTTIWISIVLCLAVGQWFLFICQLLFITGLMKMTKSAANYLKYVKVDLSKKNAVIDV
jgi:hypothetical protein